MRVRVCVCACVRVCARARVGREEIGVGVCKDPKFRVFVVCTIVMYVGKPIHDESTPVKTNSLYLFTRRSTLLVILTYLLN